MAVLFATQSGAYAPPVAQLGGAVKKLHGSFGETTGIFDAGPAPKGERDSALSHSEVGD